jgi:hypothetical protein
VKRKPRFMGAKNSSKIGITNKRPFGYMNTCWKRADAAHGGNESSVLSVSDVWYINGL